MPILSLSFETLAWSQGTPVARKEMDQVLDVMRSGLPMY